MWEYVIKAGLNRIKESLLVLTLPIMVVSLILFLFCPLLYLFSKTYCYNVFWYWSTFIYYFVRYVPASLPFAGSLPLSPRGVFCTNAKYEFLLLAIHLQRVLVPALKLYFGTFRCTLFLSSTSDLFAFSSGWMQRGGHRNLFPSISVLRQKVW